jgi:hypothetical protein
MAYTKIPSQAEAPVKARRGESNLHAGTAVRVKWWFSIKRDGIGSSYTMIRSICISPYAVLMEPVNLTRRDRSAAINSVTQYWVKGHSQILYNEVVDKRSKVSARWSQEGFVRSRTKWN